MLNKDGVFVLLCLMRNIWFLKFAFVCQIWIKLAKIHLLKGLLYLSAWDRWSKVPSRFIVYVCILGLVKIMIWTGIVWNICMRHRWEGEMGSFQLKSPHQARAFRLGPDVVTSTQRCCMYFLVRITICNGKSNWAVKRFGESARWANLTIRLVLKTNSMSARNVLKFKHPSYDAILRITLYRNLPAWPRNEEVLVAFQWF